LRLSISLDKRVELINQDTDGDSDNPLHLGNYFT